MSTEFEPPLADPNPALALLLDRLMRRIHAGVHARAPAVDTDRVGPGGGLLMMTVADHQPLSLQALARHLARDKSQITRAVQALEAKGLLQRSGCPGDARVSLLRLTPAGAACVARLQALVSEVVGDLLTPLDVAERDALRGLLGRVLADADRPQRSLT